MGIISGDSWLDWRYYVFVLLLTLLNAKRKKGGGKE